MAAPKGNEFWKVRTKHGRSKIFSTPEQLWDACCEYFEWVESHPLWEEKATQFQGKFIKDKVSKMRAMTIEGLYFYLKINKTTWYVYRERKEFKDVIHEAEQVIYSQKFAGAAADLLNANIIARDLGLADKTELDHKHTVKITDLSGSNGND